MTPLLVLSLLLTFPAGADDQAKKKAPDKPQATPGHLAQAEEKLAAGDLDGAIEILKKAAPGAGGDVSLRLGQLLERRLDLDTAADAYQAAAPKLSGAAKGEALGRLALILELRALPEAPAAAAEAAASDPEGTWPSVVRARTLAREGKGQEAAALAQKAQAAGGGVAAAAALGFAQEASGDPAAAEAAYREAAAGLLAGTATESAQVTAGIGLARVLRKTNRAAEAEPVLLKALQAAPGAVEAYKELARVKLALNRAEEAVGDAATAAALAESDPDAQRLALEVTVAKAVASLATTPDLALQDLTKLRDQKPDLAFVRVGLARAYVAKRQAEAALTELRKAVELAPQEGEAHYQLGYVLLVLKRDAASALPALEKAVAAEPGNTEYRTWLGAAAIEAKQPDRAVAELTKVVEAPGYRKLEAWVYLGQAHLNAKRYKEALAALEKANAQAPDNAAIEAFTAWAYFGLKDSKSFLAWAAKAKAHGHKEQTLLDYLARIEKGEAIK